MHLYPSLKRSETMDDEPNSFNFRNEVLNRALPRLYLYLSFPLSPIFKTLSRQRRRLHLRTTIIVCDGGRVKDSATRVSLTRRRPVAVGDPSVKGRPHLAIIGTASRLADGVESQ